MIRRTQPRHLLDPFTAAVYLMGAGARTGVGAPGGILMRPNGAIWDEPKCSAGEAYIPRDFSKYSEEERIALARKIRAQNSLVTARDDKYTLAAAAAGFLCCVLFMTEQCVVSEGGLKKIPGLENFESLKQLPQLIFF